MSHVLNIIPRVYLIILLELQCFFHLGTSKCLECLIKSYPMHIAKSRIIL